jgi:hypothetical protein
MSAQDEAAPCGYFAMSHSYPRKLHCSAVPNISGMDKSGRFEIGQDSSLLASSSPETDGCRSVKSTPTAHGSGWAKFVNGLARFHAVACLSQTLQRNVNHRREVYTIPHISAYVQSSISYSYRMIHSINGFRTPPTIAIPSDRRPSGSFARTIILAGNIGFSGVTCAASLAACSIASISSLHPAWSNGQTTMGCRNKMSFAEDICA